MIKHGLIGIGRMGRYHFKLLQEIHNAKFVAVSDLNKPSQEELDAHNITFFSDYKEMLKVVDSVTVAVPTTLHYDVVKEALNAGVHVLVEKPICTKYEQAVELFELAQKKKLTLMLGHVERFNGAIQELEKIVHKPYLIESRRVGPFIETVRTDSIILDLMIHDIDLILNIAKSNIVDVKVSGRAVKSLLPDYAVATLIFENNLCANIVSSRITEKKERTMTISQENALIQLDFTNQDINIYRKGSSHKILHDDNITYKNEYIQERLFVYKDNPLKLEIMAFFDVVKSKTTNPDTIAQIEKDLHSMKIIFELNDKLLKEY